MKILVMLGALLSLISCAGNPNKISSVNQGMTKAEVLALLGKPSSAYLIEDKEYFTYIFDKGITPTKAVSCAALGLLTLGTIYASKDCSTGGSIDYFIEFKANKITSFGEVREFSAIRSPS